MSEQLEQQAREAILNTIIAQANALKAHTETYPSNAPDGEQLRNVAEAWAIVTADGEPGEPV